MSWIDEELSQSKFVDKRLGKRLMKIIKQLAGKIGSSIPTACQDWANTKATYRFFSNPNLTEEEILAGHFQSTKQRFEVTSGPILVLHDTTEITYKRYDPEGVGYTRKCGNPRGLFHQEKKRAMCGILMHSSLVLTPEGLPLGFAAKKFWNRDKFKDIKSLYRRKNATRIPIEEKESFRWPEGVRNVNKLLGEAHRIVHIGDREADIYDLFHLAQADGSQFLVRVKVNRRTQNESITMDDVIKEARPRGNHVTTYRDKDGKEIEVKLQIKFEKIVIKPSYGPKTKIFPDLEVVVIRAKEISNSGGSREPINWRLITNLPVSDLSDAIEKLEWYALRWKIEVFFKILKSGCKIEESKLRTAEALCKMIAINCIVAWRVFWMTMINREGATLPAELVLSETEIKILDHLKPDSKQTKKSLSTYLTKIAKLGGYLARSSDPPPGNNVMWRGIQRLNEIQIGVEIGMNLVGN